MMTRHGAPATERARRSPRRRRLAPSGDAGGYSLIEVLAAAALLLGVLLAILTMFILGQHTINAGKLMTKASSIATDVHEEIRELNFRQTYELIEDGGNPAEESHYCWDSLGGADPDVSCDSYNEPEDPDYLAMLEAWQQQVEDELPVGSSITITVRGLEGPGNPAPEEAFRTAELLQVVVSVHWTERKRKRSVVFETLKS